MLPSWRFLVAVSVGALLGTVDVWAAEESTTHSLDAPATAGLPRGDATSDPLLLLLRSPAIRRELRLEEPQVQSLERLVDAVDEPLWRLRDAQFTSAANSAKAWQLIDRVESSLGEVMRRDQQTQLRQLVVRARGLQGLLSRDVTEGLKLSQDRVQQIAAAFEETRKETQQIQTESAGDGGRHRARMLEKAMADERKKVLGLLTDQQKRRWEQLAGKPYDFSQLPRRYVRAPEIRGVDEWVNSVPLTLSGLRGRVVALHFFTYGCINCIHNQPAYRDWHERFSSKGAVVLGIHTPEGESDRSVSRIRRALQDQDIRYAVAVDNEKENWTAWANHTWPAVYLIDKEGFVRYWWYGELNWQGAQGEKLYRDKIAELLAEGDLSLSK